jgi:hypothetical protein
MLSSMGRIAQLSGLQEIVTKTPTLPRYDLSVTAELKIRVSERFVLSLSEFN